MEKAVAANLKYAVTAFFIIQWYKRGAAYLITYMLCGVRYPTSLTPHACNNMKYSELHGFRVVWGRKRKFKYCYRNTVTTHAMGC